MAAWHDRMAENGSPFTRQTYLRTTASTLFEDASSSRRRRASTAPPRMLPPPRETVATVAPVAPDAVGRRGTDDDLGADVLGPPWVPHACAPRAHWCVHWVPLFGPLFSMIAWQRGSPWTVNGSKPRAPFFRSADADVLGPPWVPHMRAPRAHLCGHWVPLFEPLFFMIAWQRGWTVPSARTVNCCSIVRHTEAAGPFQFFAGGVRPGAGGARRRCRRTGP